MAGEVIWTPSARGLSLRAHFGANKHASALGTHYFGLFTDYPLGAGVEAAFTNGYGRATVANGLAAWGSPAVGDTQVVNQADIVWPAATGAWAGGPFTWWAILSASTGGTLWYCGRLSAPAVVDTVGNQPRILAGGLTIIQA